MEEKKDITSYEEVEEISKKIGMNQKEDKTIFEIQTLEGENKKILELKSGSWKNNEPWFGIDESQKLHALVSVESLTKLANSLKATQQENFNLKLEKTIWQHIPVDFQDVWMVAMDEIRQLAKDSIDVKSINIDLDRLVGNIKKEHPNLFVNLKDIIFQNEHEEEDLNVEEE